MMNANAWIALGLVALAFSAYAITHGFNLKTQKLPQNESRPWISILSLHTDIEEDYMAVKVRVTNSGKLPAYVKIVGNGYKNGTPMQNATNPSEPALLMPDQIGKNDLLLIKGESYKAILNGTLTPVITLEIRVDYGSEKEDVGTFYIYRKVKLDYDRLQSYIDNPSESVEYWLHEESDFR